MTTSGCTVHGPKRSASTEATEATEATTDLPSPKRPCVEQSIYAVIYKWVLDRIDPTHPLFGTPYIGQTVRHGLTCQEMFDKRKREHISDSRRHPKDLGLHWAIRVFGEDAFTVRMVETEHLPLTQAQQWANAREIALIAEHGGVMRDCDPCSPMHQTFNLTPGGQQGDPQKVWGSIEALSRKKLKKVWPKFEAYQAEHGHLNAPLNDPALGTIVHHIRTRKDFLWHADFKAWLYDHGFKMHAKDATKNAEKWAEVNEAPPVPGG